VNASAIKTGGPKQFLYENMWERHLEFKGKVNAGWAKSTADQTTTTVRAKLKTLADDLGGWGTETFGSVRKEIKKLKLELERLRSLPHCVRPSHVEIKINDHLVKLYHMEEIMWRQRSRIDWLSKGDRNSKFFHQRASMRQRKNLIKTLTRTDGHLT
jgi:hypothetical protein